MHCVGGGKETLSGQKLCVRTGENRSPPSHQGEGEIIQHKTVFDPQWGKPQLKKEIEGEPTYASGERFKVGKKRSTLGKKRKWDKRN